MGDQIYSIEFLISFLTIYNNIVCTDGKVPAKIILLYGGISSYELARGHLAKIFRRPLTSAYIWLQYIVRKLIT